VAEACAGLRFLIASIAFGALYAVTMFRSPWRRVAFIAISCVVPVVANGFRGLGIVMLGHVLGSAEAAATDHILYGWIFFSLVIVALALAGMPFRQDPAPVRLAFVPPQAGTRRHALLTVLPVIGLAALGPAIAAGLDARAEPGAAAQSVLITPADCAMTGASPDNTVLVQSFRCGDATLVARTETLPRRANPAWVVRAGNEWAASMVPGHDVDNRMLAVDGPTPMMWRLVLDEDSPRAAASLVFVDGAPASGGVRDRLKLAGDLLNGSADAPVALAVAITGGDGDPAEVLRHFLGAQGDLMGRVGRLSKARGSAPGPR
jgi:exosortase/archaeosortase family protein